MPVEQRQACKWVPVVDTDLCVACGLCTVGCDVDCLKLVNDVPVLVESDACTSCGDCIEWCQDAAIRMTWVPMDGDAAAGRWDG